jgi:hypothetical protein
MQGLKGEMGPFGPPGAPGDKGQQGEKHGNYILVELNLNACQRVQVKMARKVHLDRKVGKVNLADLETRD